MIAGRSGAHNSNPKDSGARDRRTNLVYIVTFRRAWTTQRDAVSKQTNKQNHKQTKSEYSLRAGLKLAW
jgi:hypothetical protein